MSKSVLEITQEKISCRKSGKKVLKTGEILFEGKKQGTVLTGQELSMVL